MASEPAIRVRALEALRAAAMHPLGLRLSAHPKAMQALVVLGYAVKRQARWEGAKPIAMGRFIMPAGGSCCRPWGNELLD